MRNDYATELTMDLVGEAQLRMDEWRRPQQGVDIRRKRGKRSSKPMLMKCGDCNRRGGEPPQKNFFQIQWNQICKETDKSFDLHQTDFF